VPETSEEYRERLSAYVDGEDFLDLQQQTPATIAHVIDGLSVQQLRHRPAPDKWSIVEILAHLAEDELTSSWRYRQMIEHDGTILAGFDQELWARLGSYPTWSPSDALELFRLLREANLRMLRSLQPEQWERSGIHVERGKLTVRELARHMAAHDINHIQQIERLAADQK
jgi:uncharacterized damage-inducible protein DinB